MEQIKLQIVNKIGYIVVVEGSYNFMIDEVIEFDNGVKGIVVKSRLRSAHVALLEDDINNPITLNNYGFPSGRSYYVKTDDSLLGSIIDVTGKVLHRPDEKEFIDDILDEEENHEEENLDNNDEHEEEVIEEENHEEENLEDEFVNRDIFRIARPIYSRTGVNRTLVTGMTSIDWSIPIAMGQRELILGDRKTGKTSIALNMILSQKNTQVKCVYVSIGQKRTNLLEFIDKIKNFGMLDRTIIVAAFSDGFATEKYLVPYVGMTFAEYFQEKYGDDVLIVFDDLSQHANAYRELSLLLEIPPSREAYPGDVFYLHSKLLERAGAFNGSFGGGSITAIPIVQTEDNDISSFIPTNVISITDGQIFVSKSLFNSGHRPAIDVPYSVSRVGSTAQSGAVKHYSSGIKLLFSRYSEAMKIAKMSDVVSKENLETIRKGKILNWLVIQQDLEIIDYKLEALLLILFQKGYLDFFQKEDILELKRLLIKYLNESQSGKKLSSLLIAQEIDLKEIDLFIFVEIAPIIKYQLLSSNSNLAKNRDFMKLFANVRNESRVFLSNKRREETKEITNG